MSHSPDLPVPISSERDNDGRLVGLAFDSVPALARPEVNPWLVAVDSSDNALRAVAHAVQQAGEMNACALHLVHVQPWLSKEAAEAELAHRAWLASERARGLLDAKGYPWRLHAVMGDVAEGILHLAQQLRCSGIVIGSRGLGVTEGLLFGSVTSKLMHLGGPPLAVVP
ncbi:universal stress protein [Propionivibrio sp.]|uniref:universal stress protein n=1 Tax=Propionivibrio sp. TaxID=2212460 RepID=UPI003BF0F25F